MDTEFQHAGGEGARRHRRRRLMVAGAVLLVVGVAARFGLSGLPADAAGGVAYAAFAYVLIAWIAPGQPPVRVGAAALAFCIAVELFQLTAVPQALADAFPPSRLVLGTSFAAADLPPYVVGTLLAMAADALGTRRSKAAPPSG